MHAHPVLRTVADMDAYLPFPLANMLKTVAFREGRAHWCWQPIGDGSGSITARWRRRLASIGGRCVHCRRMMFRRIILPCRRCLPDHAARRCRRCHRRNSLDDESRLLRQRQADRPLEISSADLVRLSGARVLPISRLD